MRLVITTAAALALVTCVPGTLETAHAHGGAYRGPAGEIPPNSREPSDPPPPSSGNGPTTPGGRGTGPSTGGSLGSGPTTGGSGGGRGPATGSGPSTGGSPFGGAGTGGAPVGGGASGPGYEDWTFWWNFNKDPFLRLRDAVRSRDRGVRSRSWLHRSGKKQGGSRIVTATDAAIRNRIVPALRAMLEDRELDFDIQSAAALALAKIGDPEVVPYLRRMALNQREKGRYHPIVVESAALAFGVLQKDDDEIRELLMELVVDRDRNASLVRPFAAVSLGLLPGGDEGVSEGVSQVLLDVIARKESKQDVKPACLLALGLRGDDAVVADLLHMLEKGRARQKGAVKLSDTDLSYAVGALGRIGAPGTAQDPKAVVRALIERSDARRHKHKNLRRSAVIALAQVAPQCDVATQKSIVSTLFRVVEDGKDASECNFAMISLGRLGAARDVDAGVRNRTIKLLQRQVTSARPAALKRPFAALALGLVGRGIVDAGGTVPEDEIRAPLREGFAQTRSPRARGAFAVASGLVRDPLATESLLAVFEDRGNDDRLRGYCALALGMIGDASANDAIVAVLSDEDENDRNLRVQTSVAAGLIGDGRAIAPLVEILDSAVGQYELGSAALSLGQIGDERAIDPLLDIATGKHDHPALTRALATVALGQLGDRSELPVLSTVAEDLNYRAHVRALAELLTIL